MVMVEWVEDTTGDVIPDAYKVEYDGNVVYTNVGDTSVEVDGSELNGDVEFRVYGYYTGATSNDYANDFISFPKSEETEKEYDTGTYVLRPYYSSYRSSGSLSDYWDDVSVSGTLIGSWATSINTSSKDALADDDTDTYYYITNSNGLAYKGANGVFDLKMTSGSVPTKLYRITNIKMTRKAYHKYLISSFTVNLDPILMYYTFSQNGTRYPTLKNTFRTSTSVKTYSAAEDVSIEMPGGTYLDTLDFLMLWYVDGYSTSCRLCEMTITVNYEVEV